MLTPPDELLTCRPSPSVPDQADDHIVALYIVDLWDAGQDCRSRIDAIRSWTASVIRNGRSDGDQDEFRPGGRL